jgi:hypothetical protein
VVGIDIDDDDVALAKKNLDEAYKVNVETDDLNKLGTFDIIVMADVIEHLIDPVGALKKIKKQLKKDGKLVFSIPNMANVTTRLDLLKGRFEYKDFGLLDRTHLHFYDHQEVNRVITEAGLEVRKTDCTTRDIPDKILKKELAEVGIELTPKLKKQLVTTDALTYQFIGYCVPVAKPKSFNQQTSSPLDAVSREVDRLTKSYDEQLAYAKGRADQAKKEAAALSKELNDIYDSKGWKMLSKVYKAKHVVTHPAKK